MTFRSTQVSFSLLTLPRSSFIWLWSPNDWRKDPWKQFPPNWKCQGQQSLGDHQPGSVHAEEEKEGYEAEWRCFGMFICLLNFMNFIYPLPKNVMNSGGDDCILAEIFTSQDFNSSKFFNSPNPKQYQLCQQITKIQEKHSCQDVVAGSSARSGCPGKGVTFPFEPLKLGLVHLFLVGNWNYCDLEIPDPKITLLQNSESAGNSSQVCSILNFED